MKIGTMGIVAALLAGAAPASAQTWVQFNFSGAGGYHEENSWDGTSMSGNVGLSGSFTVEIEPGADGYWSSNGFRFDNYPDAGPEQWTATANNGTLSFAFTNGCAYSCENWNITLHYAAGTFSDGFPTSLSDPLSSSFTYRGIGDGRTDAAGSIHHVSARIVNGIQDPSFHLAVAVPEPASWSMMLGGFGLVGGALRARRKVIVRFA